MDDHFEPEELLFRSIKPQDSFWKENGELTSAAFKDVKGASVDRAGGRSVEESAKTLHSRKSGTIVSVYVSDCMDCHASVFYRPEIDNRWHSEIHQSESVVKLSGSQLKHLARAAKIVLQ